jgi:type IV pilus assembly protein PilN
MIRINLVAPEKAAKAKTRVAAGPAIPTGALQSYLLLVVFAGGALVLCAGAWWYQSNKLKDLETRIAADEKRERDLQAIKQQVDQFQQRKAILENKVLVIEQLRLAQKSPVHMLDEISKALPDYVWLTGMEENRGAVGSRARATAWRRSPTSSARSSAAAGSRRSISEPARRRRTW